MTGVQTCALPISDVRWLLMLAVLGVFWRTRVRFIVTDKQRAMPLVLAFALIGFFIWIAENISTYLGAWAYPHQHSAWQLVSFRIISSWFLLVIVSFIIVADLKHVRKSASPHGAVGQGNTSTGISGNPARRLSFVRNRSKRCSTATARCSESASP